MAREPNKNRGACKLRSLLKKHQMTKLYKVVNDKPYLMTVNNAENYRAWQMLRRDKNRNLRQVHLHS